MRLTKALPLLLALPAGLLAAAADAAPQAAQRPSPEFWEAIARDDVARVQTLLLRGADTNAVHPELGPAIVAAAREKSWKTVTLLAGLAGTRVDVPNRRGETALMLAALHGQLEVARLLVRKGAEINRTGWTPLHYAATNGHADVARYLLDENAYIDAQSPNRTTPLMMAARHGHSDAVRLLVQAGADPTARNEAGVDAAGYLQRQGQPELAQWVRERAADYTRRYGTLERPRTVEMIEEEKRRAERGSAPRLPGTRD
ncbi:MAG: ankyrin repeat domain-containing protein [Burkholderiaceae bacterium]|nr:ankyrin repeat domain-containing protein [Burkholderiaceae bacterium]